MYEDSETSEQVSDDSKYEYESVNNKDDVNEMFAEDRLKVVAVCVTCVFRR